MSENQATRQARLESLERDRLITKGRSVLDLCIEQQKVLCVKGFVDSQIERGGVYLEVVHEMRTYLESSLAEDRSRQERNMISELHAYLVERLDGADENLDRLTDQAASRGSRNGVTKGSAHHNGIETGRNGNSN